MVIITFFRDRKKALAMLIITGALFLGCLVTGGALYGMELYKAGTYRSVTATVTDYDTRDSKNVWTELFYTLDGQTHAVRIKGHSYWMKKDSEIAILVHPTEPEQIEIADYSGTSPKVALIASIPFGIFFLLYLINYIRVRRRS